MAASDPDASGPGVSAEYRLTAWQRPKATFAMLWVPLGPALVALTVLTAATLWNSPEPVPFWRVVPIVFLGVLLVPTGGWQLRYLTFSRFRNPIRATADQDRIEFETPRVTISYPWSTVRKVYERMGFMFVSVHRGHAHVIPITDETARLRAAIRAQVELA